MKTLKVLLLTGFLLTFLNVNSQIKVDANGKVGIGEDSPEAKVEIKSSGTIGAKWNPAGSYLKVTDGNTSLIADGNELHASSDLHLGALNNIYLRHLTSSGSTITMHLSTGGNVGVGITPSYKLHVAGDIYANGGQLKVSGTNGLYFQSYGGGFHMQDATWIRTSGNKSFYHNTGTMRTDGTFEVGSGGSRFLINTSGNVGIGQTSPTCKLDVEGVIKSNGVVVTSDERFKENIKDLNAPVSSIKRLRPVEYTMKKMEETAIELSQEELLLEESLNPGANSPMDSLSLAMLPKEKPKEQEKEKTPNLEDDYYERNRIGFLAQDMEQVFPELVYTDKNGYKSIDYTSLIPVLVKGMQEQQEIIEIQQQQMHQQQTRIEQQQQQIEELIKEVRK